MDDTTFYSLNEKRRAYVTWLKGYGPSLIINIRRKKVCICFCHHRKDRSIKFFGLERYLCARDLGIFMGALFGGLIFYIFNFTTNLWILLLFMIPMIADGSTQLLGWRESINPLRLLTGFLFGFALLILLGGVLFG